MEHSCADAAISDFWTLELWENDFFLVLSHPVCDSLLEQLQETNTIPPLPLCPAPYLSLLYLPYTPAILEQFVVVQTNGSI